MKNKGFTVVELISAFAIASLIMVLLINLVVVIRNIYNKNNTRTELYIIQGNLSNALNKKIGVDNLSNVTKCTDKKFCYEFTFVDGDRVKLSTNNNIIKFGKQTFKLDKNSYVENPTITTETIVGMTEDKNDSLLKINIPIKNKLYPEEEFGINLVYQYNSNKLFFDVDSIDDYANRNIIYKGFLYEYNKTTIAPDKVLKETFKEKPESVTVVGKSTDIYINGQDYTYNSENGSFTFKNVPEDITIIAGGIPYCTEYLKANKKNGQILTLKLNDCLKIADYGNYTEEIDLQNYNENTVLDRSLTAINSRTNTLDLEKVEPYANYSMTPSVQEIQTKKLTDTITATTDDNNLKFNTSTGYYEPYLNKHMNKTEDGTILSNCFAGTIEDLIDRIPKLQEGLNYYYCADSNHCRTLYKINSFTQENGVVKLNVTKYSSSVDLENSSNKPGLYKFKDNYTEEGSDNTYSLLYRGMLDNNWVKLGDLYYRIIRINGDGSIRLMYSGTSSEHFKTDLNSSYTSKNYCTTCSSALGYMMNPKTTYMVSDEISYTGIKNAESYFFNTLIEPTYDSDTGKYNFTNSSCTPATYDENGNITSIAKCTLTGYMPVTEDNNETINEVAEAELNKKVAYKKLIDVDEDKDGTFDTFKYSCANNGTPNITTVQSNGSLYKKVEISCETVNELTRYSLRDEDIDTLYISTYHKMYGFFSESKEEADKNIVDSNAKTVVDKWYKENIKDNNLEQYLSDEIFCNDRTISNGGNGFIAVPGNRDTYYNGRVVGDSQLICPRENDMFTLKAENDASTVSSSDYGNHELKYPVGLPTYNELLLAGGVTNLQNYKYYLYPYKGFMTMTPAAYNTGAAPVAYIGRMYVEYGMPHAISVSTYTSLPIRPVINLSKDVYFDGGAGTEKNPYTVKLETE